MLLTGRAPFPVRALRWARPRTMLDFDVIERSHRLGEHFHGVVELEGHVPQDALAFTGWRTYCAPWRQRRRA